jgi:lipoprotein NlpI
MPLAVHGINSLFYSVNTLSHLPEVESMFRRNSNFGSELMTRVPIAILLLVASTKYLKASEDTSARQLLGKAAQALADSDYKTARELAERAVQLSPNDPFALQPAAEILYRSGFPQQSLELFERAVSAQPQRAAENWQRGIALATCGEFKKGADQFRIHHEVNPDDVENSAWYFLCVAKTDGIEAARKSLLPSRGDPRQPMMSILQMYRGEITPEQVLDAASNFTGNAQQQASAAFYAKLYIGLYFDALGSEAEAQQYLSQSCQTDVSGYMADVARVYLDHRFKNDKFKDDRDRP